MLTVEPDLIEAYVRTGRALYVFRPVLNHGERSLRTSEAAACAAEQGRFWDAHELLFARQDEVWATAPADLPALLAGYADTLGLDRPAFDACLQAGAALALVRQLDADQRARGITTQPIFEIGDQRIVGQQPLSVFRRIIERTP